MKNVLLILAVLVGLIFIAGLVLYLLGRAQPERHTARRSFTVPQSPAAVWGVLTDYAAMPQWWPAVKAVRMEKRPNGETVAWNQDSHGREIGFRTKEEKAPVRLVREIVGDDLPWGGTWTYELAEEKGGGTRVTLTEDGFIKPPLFRAVARYFIGLDATMKDFESHLTARLAAK
ncbi:MAG TPA: SRPBCC domain-containing protein [Opitutaceae bacterium]|nr:SRPBCC domain-containing protein [Opitutaceae bacterium]